MADKENGRVASRDLGRASATDIASTAESDPNHGLHFVRRGEALAEASSSQGSIDGYDPGLMSGRTLLTAAEEKKLLRKIDWRLMTLCSLIFMFKNLDSNNASNARIMNKGTNQNIMTQLGITSNEYNLVTVLYYVPYIVLEAPSNLLLKRFSPSKWQSRIMITWGIVLMCNAAVKNKGGLYATRFLLGVAEAGQFPGVILQMTYWYRPDEMSLRLLYFYVCGNVSGIIGGLLAFAFDTVSGAGGLSGWQWLFLTEGIATVIFGVAIWFLLPDFPETATWLTEREKKFIQARLPSNAPRANEKDFQIREIIASLKDIRLWLFTFIWATFTVGTSGVTFYQSTVIANLGFTSIAAAQLLNIPITVCGLLFIAATGITADRSRIPRPLYPLSFLIVIISCYGVFVAYPSNGAVYAVTLIGNALTAGWYPVMWPWRVQTTSRATGSAFSIGFVNSYGQIGGAIGPQLFRSEYAPHYTVPFSVAMGLVGVCAVLILVTWWVTWDTERDTRRLKLAKIAAEKRGETILEDVVDKDLQGR
ncbi:Putative Pantothenate transporter [Penicillium brasilianum]|uniref:Putative Pantothenate transporter n=1 Tax=Penicillium brasilianum TaxID=104259 RepID=A0A0F7TYU2_PENBI|nr:Putative Pantothenate transporter [Penicillium brasilianum]